MKFQSKKNKKFKLNSKNNILYLLIFFFNFNSFVMAAHILPPQNQIVYLPSLSVNGIPATYLWNKKSLESWGAGDYVEPGYMNGEEGELGHDQRHDGEEVPVVGDINEGAGYFPPDNVDEITQVPDEPLTEVEAKKYWLALGQYGFRLVSDSKGNYTSNLDNSVHLITSGANKLRILQRLEKKRPGGGTFYGFIDPKEYAWGHKLIPVAEADPYVTPEVNGLRPMGNNLSLTASNQTAGISNVFMGPLSPDPFNPTAKTGTVPGPMILDLEMRRAFGYDQIQNGGSLPLFGLLSYFHPEGVELTYETLAQSTALQGNYSHGGFYFGNGHSGNAPYSYHNGGFQVGGGYPTNITLIEYAGASSPEIFNQNILTVSHLLNQTRGGVEFSSIPYDRDPLIANNLKESLDFFYDWMTLPEKSFQARKSNPLWGTYCQEHVTIILNVALNVAQNRQGYIDVYGKRKGEILWKEVQRRWAEPYPNPKDLGAKKINREEPFGSIPEGDNNFIPLWKLMGLNSDSEKGIYNSTQINKKGFSLAWKMLDTLDLISIFDLTYLNFTNVDPNAAISGIYGMAEEASGRLGISKIEFVQAVYPITKSMFSYGLVATVLKERLKISSSTLLKSQESEALTRNILSQLAKGYSSYYQSADLDPNLKTILSGISEIKEGANFSESLIKEIVQKVENFKIETKNSQKLEHWIKISFKKDNKVNFLNASKILRMKNSYAEQKKLALKSGENLNVEDYSAPAVIPQIVNGEGANSSSVAENSVRHYVRLAYLGTLVDSQAVYQSSRKGPIAINPKTGDFTEYSIPKKTNKHGNGPKKKKNKNSYQIEMCKGIFNN